MKQKIYLPTPLQCAVLPLCTVLLLVLANTKLISERVSNGATGGAAVNYMSSVGRLLDGDVANSVGVFVFWLFVGAGAYALIGAIVLIVHPLITMAHVSQAVGHRSAKATQHINHLLFTRFVVRTIAAACLTVWFAANVIFVLRFIDGAATEFIRTGSMLMALAAVIVGTIDLFLFVVLLRVLLLRTRLF